MWCATQGTFKIVGKRFWEIHAFIILPFQTMFWPFHSQEWPKRTFFLQYRYVFKRKGDEKRRKYNLRDIVWCKTNFAKRKFLEMHGGLFGVWIFFFLSERGRWATSWFVCLERKMPRVFQLVVFVYSTLTILALVCVIQDVFRSSFNPLRLNICMHILHTILYIFPKVLTRRMRLTIKSFFSWWSFSLFSWP